MSSKKAFAGELATPFKRRRVGVLVSDDEKMRLAELWTREDFEKLDLLVDHYEIVRGPAQWIQLSLALAREFVPGFQEQKPVGRPNKWGIFERMALTIEMKRLIDPKNRTHGETWAARQLAKREPWKSFVARRHSDFGPNPAEALRKQYRSDQKTATGRAARQALEAYELNGAMDEWERMVLSVGKLKAT